MSVHQNGARWDLFCRVIDNLGDIGVCWRLARCLKREHGCRIRLWVDDLKTFARIAHSVDPTALRQVVGGIEIGLWDDIEASRLPGDVVVETFGCGLPEQYLQAMIHSESRSVWIQLEYLSAEAWIDDFHGRASPLPQRPLMKYFFFPGFSRRSGGLLRESDLERARDTFVKTPNLRDSWWIRTGLLPPEPNEQRVSLFAYPNTGLPSLLEAWANDMQQRWTVIVPEDVLAIEIEQFLGFRLTHEAPEARVGALHLKRVPFFEQDDYDRLLWACDLNFVRGEDSFVRAQWAQRPFVWHIYPQADAAHQIKLDAFLDRYLSAWPDRAAVAVRAFWHGWNSGDSRLGRLWPDYRQALQSESAFWPLWAETLLAQGDLATELVAFARLRAV